MNKGNKRNYFVNIVKNLFSLTYYTEVLTGTQRFRWLLATLLLALLFSIRPTLFIITKVYQFVKDVENKMSTLVQETYPQELEITIKHGVASTNVTEPYYLTIRQETLENVLSLKEEDQNTRSRVRILAIDTKGEVEEFEQYQSLALLTQSSLVYYSSDQKINIQSLREIEDLTINKELILAKIKEYNKKYNISTLLNVFVFLSPFLAIIGSFLLQLFVFLLYTVAVYSMVRIKQVPAGFKNSYRYTAVVALAPTILWNLASFIPVLAGTLFFAGTLLTMIILGIAYLGIQRVKQKPTP